MVSDNENNQYATSDAFELLDLAAEKCLARKKLTVIDATNLKPNDRSELLAIARRQNVHAVAIVLNLPESILQQRNQERGDRCLNPKKIQKHVQDVKRSIKSLKKEGFRYVYALNSVDEIENTEIVRTKLWNNKMDEHGPFDIIGDIHGCLNELEQLLLKMGYENKDGQYSHPNGRKVVFLGDFCDRNVGVLRLVMNMVKSGNAYAVPGNHDVKLLKYLDGRTVQQTHGLDKTIAEIESAGDEFKKETAEFIRGLISHYVFDDGKLAVAHAGIKEEYIGRTSPAIREFCLYGEKTGEEDEYGLPILNDWAADYKGRTLVVYGHVPSKRALIQNNTVRIDTGCVYGGSLTALKKKSLASKLSGNISRRKNLSRKAHKTLKMTDYLMHLLSQVKCE